MIRLIFKRDFITALQSPMFYIVSGIFLLTMGWMFFNLLLGHIEFLQSPQVNDQNPQLIFLNMVVLRLWGNMNFLFLMIIPLFALRSVAEEKRSHTINLYLIGKSSMRDFILGKYFSLVGQVMLMLMMTSIYAVFLALIGLSDPWFLLGGQLAPIMNILALAALAIWSSSLTENPILAVMIAFLIGLFFWLIHGAAYLTSNLVVAELLKYISLAPHFETLAQGEWHLSDFGYYISFIFMFLYLSYLNLDAKEW